MEIMAKKRPDVPAPQPNPWPERLRALREQFSLTQEEAAQRMSASLGAWRNWEQGRRTPNAAIVRLLELTFPEFFGKS